MSGSKKKKIYYMLIAKGQKVLCDYTPSKANYAEFTNEILSSIPDKKVTIPYEE